MATKPRTVIATLDNAYRVATKIASQSDADMQVSATGNADQPYVAEPANSNGHRVVARIIKG
jgi:hypothetical protein